VGAWISHLGAKQTGLICEDESELFERGPEELPPLPVAIRRLLNSLIVKLLHFRRLLAAAFDAVEESLDVAMNMDHFIPE